MRALFNGIEGGSIPVYRGQDIAILLQLLTLDGALINLTGDVVQFQLFDTADRRNAAILAITAALTTPTAGFTTVTVTDTQTLTLIPGATYYCFARRDIGTASNFVFGRAFAIVTVA